MKQGSEKKVAMGGGRKVVASEVGGEARKVIASGSDGGKKGSEKKAGKVRKKAVRVRRRVALKVKSDKKKTETEKLEERREEALARGRKFKYPLQYAKHRLVVVTVVIAVLAVLGMGVAGWVSLYKVQSTSDMMYRITRFLPLPVAEIDGENVRYSDYLMIYRSSITPVEQQTGQMETAEDTENMQEHYKRLALTDAENYTYVEKLGKEYGVEVTDEMVDKAFDEHRKVGGEKRSEESFLKVLSDNFGLTKDEYRRMLYLSLMKTEVAQKIDENAKKLVEEVKAKLAEPEADMKAVAESFGDKVTYEETGGLVDMMNVDGGRAVEAAKLEPGAVSEYFVSSNGDGYYFVKLIEKRDGKVSYASIKVPLAELAERLKKVREEGKVREFIEVGEEESGES